MTLSSTKKYFFLLTTLLAASIRLDGHSKGYSPTSVHADFEVLVNERIVKSTMEYSYVATEVVEASIKFYLTSEVRINYLKGGLIKSFDFDKQTSPLPTVTIFLKKPLAKGDVFNFSLSYAGQLSKVFQTEPYNWVDLDSDFILFPLFTDFHVFTYTLKATLDNPSYKFIDADELLLKSSLTVSSTVPDYAFASLFACKGVQVISFRENKNKFNIISNQPDSLQQKWITTASRILTYYNSTFGKNTPKYEVTILFKPLPLSINPVQKTNGNVIVLASDSNEETLAHELAHLWWTRGNHSTMEKWLTESFAVYSQLMYWRSEGHQMEFDQEIARLKARTEKLPPLLKADRFGYDGNTLIYSKGPYLLSVLEYQLGRNKFTRLLSNLNSSNVSTTLDFLSELEKIESSQLRDEFEKLLSK